MNKLQSFSIYVIFVLVMIRDVIRFFYNVSKHKICQLVKKSA